MLVIEGRKLASAEALQELHGAAQAARANAYAPYSKFRVGAALRVAEGNVVTGGNVENASYGLTICAERAAVFRALALGYTAFQAVAIAGPAPTVAPCGACRQVLAEFLSPDAPVVFPVDGELLAVPLGELIPHAFGPENVLSGS